MDMRQITTRFYASPQISVEDMPAIAAAGIKLIICNRPDAEIPPSHHCAVMADAAKTAGIEFAIQPLTHQTMTPEIISANRALIDGCDGAVLAYCASGTRSTIAWALSAAKDMTADQIIQAARNSGYDLESYRQTFEAIGSDQS